MPNRQQNFRLGITISPLTANQEICLHKNEASENPKSSDHARQLWAEKLMESHTHVKNQPVQIFSYRSAGITAIHGRSIANPNPKTSKPNQSKLRLAYNNL